MIDVIIPAYRGVAATRRCVESVLAARCETPHEVVVVDDATPEPEIAASLQALAAAGRITLRVHPENQGFVRSVNEAMALHPERDVVLLNSDTEVPPGWLDRLVACARREPGVATVTPFSNNATICSYPRFLAANALPEGWTTAALDAAFAAANAGSAVEIPTAVGFCMLIARRALEAVGDFDAQAFGRGYGEEVDFCMRASAAGMRHLLCADLFVYHQGEVSFGGDGAAMRERAQAIVDERHPGFQAAVHEFIAREPARPLRRAADLERLRRSPRPVLLAVSHDWGGGIERHLRDVAALLAKDRETLVLRPAHGGRVSLEWLRSGEEFRAWFDADTEWDACVALLRSLPVDRIHVHHVHGHTPRVLQLPALLGVPCDATLHDHYAICTNYHLTREDGRYCGDMEGRCAGCPAPRMADWPAERAQWRATMREFLLAAERVIVPSHDMAMRVRRALPGVEPVEWSHPEMSAAAPVPYKVLVLGGISAIKGARLLEACVADAHARRLPLHYVVLGHVDKPMKSWPEAPLSVRGSYEEGTLPGLIALERGDAFAFLSQVPESYSYTLSAALATGLPILAPRLGAYPERLRDHPGHMLVEAQATAVQVNDTLLSRLRQREPRAVVAAAH